MAGSDDPLTQFRGVWARIGQILEQAGSDLDHIIDITTYHLDMHAHIDAFIEAKNEALGNLPTWTAVGVTELYSPGVLIEVKVIAAVVGADSGGADVDLATQVLDGAQRAVGSWGAPSPLQVFSEAQVTGPAETFRTIIHSSSDGHVRMEQPEFGFVAGVDENGSWRLDEDGQRVDDLGDQVSYLYGHELHLLALDPRSRFPEVRFLGRRNFDSVEALAVEMTNAAGNRLVAYFQPADTLPVGFEVGWTDPPVVVRLGEWEEQEGFRVFREASFAQGDEVFRYWYEVVRVG